MYNNGGMYHNDGMYHDGGMYNNGSPYHQNGPIVQHQPGMQPGMYPRGRGMRAVPAFMPAPALIPGIPPGLEYLACVNGIVVNQLVELLEVFTGFETKNRYSLCNPGGQQAYFAYEESSFAARQFAGKDRPFTIFIADNSMRPVIMIHRPYTCCSGDSCCGCHGCCGKDECIVECPPGNVIGRIVQRMSCCALEYLIHDMSGQPMFFIDGPTCTGCCGDEEYKIKTVAGFAQIGAITKKWGGIAKEMYTDADTFIVNFPQDLDVHLKAVLVGATFLIDFMAYENNN